MRTTIKKHNYEYLINLSKEWGFDNATDTLNHLLFLLRTSNQLPQIEPKQSETILEDSKQVPHTIQDFGFSSLPYDPALAQQVDPIIERLISLGVCNEF